MASFVRSEIRDGVLVLTIDNPPVNALSPGVAEAVVEAIHVGNADPTVRAMVLIGAGKTFVAGADIREFERIVKGERPPLEFATLFNEIEASEKPVVMAIHGTALGGGLELAMSGHYRVAAPAAQVGQPEIRLGLIPGAGGTQRLPRLCGLERALRLCAFGEPIGAQEARAAGIVDQLVEGDLLEGALAFASGLPAPRRTSELPAAAPDPAVVARIRAEVEKKLRLQTAPLAAIAAVDASTRMSFSDGLAHERQLFEACLHGPQSRALIHVFFGEREVSKIPFLPKTVVPRSIGSAAVIGGGTMGRGISMCFASAGIPITLVEQTQPLLDAAFTAIRRQYQSAVSKGRLTSEELERSMALVTPALSPDAAGTADVIIEAVFEDLPVKQELFGRLDRIAGPSALLASNTSSLDIDAIAAATARPEQVLGLHFFSPAHHMRLLEVVRGRATSLEALATGMDLGRRLKKVAVLAGNCPGFIGNRMFAPYRDAAIRCVEEGASPSQVDQALVGWGMAMGPLMVGDLSGIDIMWSLRRAAGQGACLEDVLYQEGRLGQKTGAGWYLYDENRKPSPDHAVEIMARQFAAQEGIPQRSFSDPEIVDRCIGALRREGQRILEEGIALRSVDVDIVYVHGYGFPAWRGGPLFEA